jgi:ribokinase
MIDVGAPPELVVVGAINVDLVVAAGRLPGPGETVVGAGLQRHFGGKGANAAVAARRAGARVRLVGAVGADEHGAGALADLRAEGVDVAHVAVLDEHPTGVALIVVDPHGENQIAVAAGANAAVAADHVRTALAAALPTAGCVLVSTEIPGEAVTAAVLGATAGGVRCVLNPAPVIPAVLDLLDRGPLLTPNASEMADLAAMLDGCAGSARPAGEVSEAARRVMARTRAPVVVTLGGDGALVLAPGGDADHVPAPPAAVRDTTGAGDTCNGVLAARLAAGDALGAAVRVAMAAASLSVAHVGARGGMPDAGAIDTALRTA